MKIIFIRHAESEKNIGEKFDKEDDLKDRLTFKGENDVITTAAFLKNFIVDDTNSIFITGPRKRTVETMKNIAGVLSCNYEVVKELVPINPGALSGLTYDEATRSFPDLIKRRKLFVQNMISGYDLVFPEGDLFIDYEEQIKKCLIMITKKYNQFENIFIVTHRSVILAILNIYNKILGHQDISIYKYYSTPNGCIVELRIEMGKTSGLVLHGGIDDWGNSVSNEKMPN